MKVILLLLSLGILAGLVFSDQIKDMDLSEWGKPDYSICEFQPGQMVRSKVSGEIGQVITVYRSADRKWCHSNVRFQGLQEFTDTGILDDDGPVSRRPLTTVKGMRPYELEHVE